MATGERKGELLIAREASDLAFRMGQGIQGTLIRRAQRSAEARNDRIVRAEDVAAAVAELDLASACQVTGDTADGEENRTGSDAA